MRSKPLLPALAALCLGACTLTTGGATASAIDGVSVRAGPGELVVRNRGSEPVHYTAVEAETAHLLDLYFDPERWPEVSPGSELHLPNEKVTGYRPGAEEALVFLWTSSRGHARATVRFR